MTTQRSATRLFLNRAFREASGRSRAGVLHSAVSPSSGPSWAAGLWVLAAMAGAGCGGEAGPVDPTLPGEVVVSHGTLCLSQDPSTCAFLEVRTAETDEGGTRLRLVLENLSERATYLSNVRLFLSDPPITEEDVIGSVGLGEGTQIVGMPAGSSAGTVSGDWKANIVVSGTSGYIHPRSRFGPPHEFGIVDPSHTWAGSGIWGCLTGDISGYSTCGGRLTVTFVFRARFDADQLSLADIQWQILTGTGWTVPSCGPARPRSCIRP